MINLDQEIEIKKAGIIFILIAVLLVCAGLLVGYSFFWNDFNKANPLDKDIAYFEQLLNEKPDHEANLIELGWLYYRKADYDKANELLTKAVQLNDNSPKAHYNLGLVYQELKQPQKAEQAYKKVLSLDAENKYALYSLADLYLEQKRWDEAIQLLEYVTKTDPASADSFYLLGVAYEKKGFVEEARGAYNNAVKLVPNYQEAREALKRLQ